MTDAFAAGNLVILPENDLKKDTHVAEVQLREDTSAKYIDCSHLYGGGEEEEEVMAALCHSG